MQTPCSCRFMCTSACRSKGTVVEECPLGSQQKFGRSSARSVWRRSTQTTRLLHSHIRNHIWQRWRHPGALGCVSSPCHHLLHIISMEAAKPDVARPGCSRSVSLQLSDDDAAAAAEHRATKSIGFLRSRPTPRCGCDRAKRPGRTRPVKPRFNRHRPKLYTKSQPRTGHTRTNHETNTRTQIRRHTRRRTPAQTNQPTSHTRNQALWPSASLSVVASSPLSVLLIACFCRYAV